MRWLLTLALTGPAAAAAAADPDRPNVLLVVADDLGYADLGFTGCKDIPTPHLDRLAADGCRCDQAYVVSPYCSPSRAGLLTGRHPARYGYEFNPAGERAKGAPPPPGLIAGVPTLAERLKDAGYATGAVGKWHLGSGPKHTPAARGFDDFFGFLGGAHAYLPGKAGAAIRRGDDPVEEKDYLTAAFGREACAFIDRHKKEPWFLYLAFNAVHDPLQPREEDLPRVPKAEGKKRRPYAGMLVALDDAVGRVRDKLKREGLDRNTLVVFLGDNGGPTAALNPNVNGSSNGPFRGGKRQLSEGGVRVPVVVAWRAAVPAGSRLDRPLDALDLTRTVLAVAKAEPPAGRDDLDGRNLLPALRDPTAAVADRALYWRFGKQWAVRDGDWKLVCWKEDDGKVFTTGLYNLAEDSGESADRSAAEPKVAARLREACARWNSENKAPGWGTPAELAESKALADNPPAKAGAEPPPAKAQPGNPADHLPPHITRLTWFGERPEWRHDGKRFAFLNKVYGDAYEYDLATGRVLPLTDHFPHHGFTRVMYLSNGDFLLVGPSKAFDATDANARRRARHDDGVMFVLDKGLSKPPVSLGVECDEGPAVSRKSLRVAWTHGKQDRISAAEIVYADGKPKLAGVKVLTDATKFGRRVKMIETQNFVPPDDRALTVTAYGFDSATNTDAFLLDVEFGKLTNLTNSPDAYDEAEGVFPDGTAATVEHAPSGGKAWPLVDIYRLPLDGSGTLDRLTHFTDYLGWKAAQPVVSDDGKFMLFQIGKAGTEAGQGYGVFLFDFGKFRPAKSAAR